jgi:hypothetical protein
MRSKCKRTTVFTGKHGYVYFIYFNHELAYIGSTANVSQRLISHPVISSLRSFGEIYSTHIRFNNSMNAYLYEQKAIARLRPPMNFQGLGSGHVRESFFFLLYHIRSMKAIERVAESLQNHSMHSAHSMACLTRMRGYRKSQLQSLQA